MSYGSSLTAHHISWFVLESSEGFEFRPEGCVTLTDPNTHSAQISTFSAQKVTIPARMNAFLVSKDATPAQTVTVLAQPEIVSAQTDASSVQKDETFARNITTNTVLLLYYNVPLVSVYLKQSYF